MSTFSGAIAVAFGTFNASIVSSNGVVQSGTVYTAAVGRKTIWRPTNFFNQLNGSSSVSLIFQKKDPHSGAYFDFCTFGVSGSGGGSNPFAAKIDASSLQTLIDHGLMDTDYSGTLGTGNARIILGPEDRIRYIGGSTPDGSNLRLCGQTEQYFSSL